MKINRNDPCPCGSGKKYKKCCVNKKEPVIIPDAQFEIDDGVDELYNQIGSLIQNNQLDKAEKLSEKLLNEYPDYPDGLERMADLHEKRGDFAEAIKYLDKVIHFSSPTMELSNEAIDDFKAKMIELKGKLKNS